MNTKLISRAQQVLRSLHCHTSSIEEFIEGVKVGDKKAEQELEDEVGQMEEAFELTTDEE